MNRFVGIKARVGYSLACALCIVFAASPAAFARPIGSIGAWNTDNNLPTGSANSASVTYNGYAYVIGGDTNSGRLNTVYYAKLNTDGSTGTWVTSANSLPQPLVNEGAVVSNGYIYVMGGVDNTDLQNAVYYAKINSDGSVGAWTTSSHSLPIVKFDGSAAAYNGYIYFIGGVTSGGGADGAIYYAKTNADGSIDAWTTNAVSFPTGINDAASFTANGYVYLVGGQDNTGTLSTISFAKFNSDGSLGAWATNGTSLPQALNWPTAVTSDGYVYVAGGTDSGGNEQSSAYYAKMNSDGSIGAWSGSPYGLPQPIGYGSAIVAGGYMYVMGGNDNGAAESTVYSTQLGFISSDTVSGASSDTQIAVATPAGTNITNLTSSAIDSSANGGTGYSYPLDLIDFTFTTDSLVNQVSLDFPTTLQPNQVVARKYNPTTKEYITIPDATITETTISGEPALHLTYSITDGGPLDEDGTVNGVIVDPVTLAIAPATSSGSTLTDTGIDIFALSTLSTSTLIAAVAVYARKSHHASATETRQQPTHTS